MEVLLKKVVVMNQEKSLTLNLNFAMKNKDERNISKNYGYMFVEKIYNLLQNIPLFALKRKPKASCDINAIFFFLTVMRILDPDSNRATFIGSKTLYQKTFDFNVSDIFRALGEIAALKRELEDPSDKCLCDQFKRNASCLYLDATNYYFHTDFAQEGRLSQKGISKGHRLKPIVQMGLVLDSKGLPSFSSYLFSVSFSCVYTCIIYANDSVPHLG